MERFEISKGAEFVLARLEEAGFSAFAVGGSVRDFLMGKSPHDFDITTSATPEEMLSLFSDLTTFQSGITHGTVAVRIDGETVEITTFRTDGKYLDHRRPESVAFSRRLDDDLSRRDFTVNAMAYGKKEGIIDLFGGKEDIEKKLIRCVGEPERRFEEDALRILRALRFSSVLGFEIEEETKKQIHTKKSLLSFVSRERIAEELLKLIVGVRAKEVLEEYGDVFEVLFEGISPDAEAVVRAEGRLARLTTFFYFSRDFERDVISLNLPKADRRMLLSAVRALHDGVSDARRFISANGSRVSELFLSAYVAVNGENDFSRLFSKALLSGECITLDELEVKGEDIVALGVPPSKRVGEILGGLLNEVVSGKIKNERDLLLARLREKIQKNIDKNYLM